MWTEPQPWDAMLEGVDAAVILARGDDLPRGLLHALDDRGIDAVVIGHTLLAFTELLLRDTPERRRHNRPEGWGLPPRGKLLFLIAQRERWSGLDALLGATRRLLPKVAIWVGAERMLLDASDLPAPELKLAGETSTSAARPQSEALEESPEPPSAARRTRSPLESAVTPEEIEMLLQLFEPEEDPRGKGARLRPEEEV